MTQIYKLFLRQSIGAPIEPLLKEGGELFRGDLIGRPDGLGVPLHASVSGKVVELNSDFIAIEAEEEQGTEYTKLEGQGSIADICESAGICGLGGAGFPTHVKLKSDVNGGTLLINAVECEPLLKHNLKQIIKNPEALYNGAKLAKKSIKAGRVIFGIKSKNQEAIEALRKVFKAGDNFSVHEMPDLYPMGEERALIREAMGVLLKPNDLPSVADAVVMNCETVGRLHEAVELKKPMISKNLTLAGKLKNGKEAQVFMDIPLGTSLQEILVKGGGIEGRHGELIMGGPFTGKAVSSEDVVNKTSNGLIVTIDFVNERRPMGLLVCACGGNEERMRDIATKMNAEVVSVRTCQQAVDVRGTLKCENPGNCPGQAQKIMEMRGKGAEVLLIGNCSDCSNTVMCVAPKLSMPVYHQTDHIMRTVGQRLIRRLPVAK